MSHIALLRVIYVVALIAGVVMIMAGIVDFVTNTYGWSAWVCVVGGALFVVFAIIRILRPTGSRPE